MIVLQRLPGGMPEYMTLKPEYNVGNAFCAWASDPAIAFGFARREDAENFQKKFRNWFDHKVSIGEIK